MKRQQLNVILMVEYPRAWRVRLLGTYTMLDIPKLDGITLTALPNLSMHVLTFPEKYASVLGLQAGGDQ